jgi:tetratricopeptide (TPR) repeat protein
MTFVHGQRDPRWRLTPLDGAVVAFVATAALAMGAVYDVAAAWRTLGALVGGLALYGALSRWAVTPERWRAAAGVAIGLGVALALYFVSQYHHLGYPPKGAMIARLAALVGRVTPPVGDWMIERNSMGTFMEGFVLLAGGLALAASRRGERLACLGAMGVLALGLFMSASRGAWLAVAVAMLLWLALRHRPARVLLGLAAVGAVAAVALVFSAQDLAVLERVPLARVPLVHRLLTSAFVRPDRLDLYVRSLYLLQDVPFTGIGLGEQFADAYSRYALLIQVPYLTYSHNLYLEVWLQQGLPGFVAWVALLVAFYTSARGLAGGQENWLYESAWIAMTAILLHGISDARQYVDLWCWLPFFTMLGLAAAAPRRVVAGEGRSRLMGWAPIAAAIAVLLAVLVAAWPLPATWHANRGAMLQAHGELAQGLEGEEREMLLSRAAEHYGRAIAIAPERRTAHQRLGLLLMDARYYDSAVMHLEAAYRADPGNPATRKALGLAYVWVGRLDEARPLLQDARQIVEELNTWGGWRSTQGEATLAANAYRMSLLLQPDQPGVYERLRQLATP